MINIHENQAEDLLKLLRNMRTGVGDAIQKYTDKGDMPPSNWLDTYTTVEDLITHIEMELYG